MKREKEQKVLTAMYLYQLAEKINPLLEKGWLVDDNGIRSNRNNEAWCIMERFIKEKGREVSGVNVCMADAQLGC